MSTNDVPGAAGEVNGGLSPSLRGGDRLGPAYEIKFLLSEDMAQDLERRLLSALLPDPHVDPTLGGMYAVTSITCDTPDFGVFYRDPSLRNRKYRVRRYGVSDVVYLERKRSRQGRVKKKRIAAPLPELESIVEGRGGDATHEWFASELRAQGLAPVCRVRYLRRALFGVCPEGPVRVTFDRSIRGSLARGWSMESAGPERVLLEGEVVAEFKFHNAMPSLLKALVSDLKLQAMGISKYRTCVRALAGELGLELRESPA